MSTTTGEMLKQARERAGLTQKALGIALGYCEQNAQSMVTRWETDTKPLPRKHIKTICEMFDLNPLDLI